MAMVTIAMGRVMATGRVMVTRPPILTFLAPPNRLSLPSLLLPPPPRSSSSHQVQPQQLRSFSQRPLRLCPVSRPQRTSLHHVVATSHCFGRGGASRRCGDNRVNGGSGGEGFDDHVGSGDSVHQEPPPRRGRRRKMLSSSVQRLTTTSFKPCDPLPSAIETSVTPTFSEPDEPLSSAIEMSVMLPTATTSFKPDDPLSLAKGTPATP